MDNEVTSRYIVQQDIKSGADLRLADERAWEACANLQQAIGIG